jgi:putative CocE/NonD family hydrolase
VLPGAEALAQSDANVRSDTVVREFNVRVPMRDGVTLSADIYRPATSDRVPVVLVRTPYTKSTAVYADMKITTDYAELGRWWVDQGYAFVVQDVRGRGDSAGIFYPLVNEAADGFDTLAWIGGQPWSSGRVGMIGGSYLGWTQVYTAGQRSPFLKAIIPTVTPPDPDRNLPVRFGVVTLPLAPWLASVDGHTQQDLSPVDIDAVYRSLPLITLDTRMGRNLPVWREWVSHPTHDAYWRAQSYQEKLLKAKVPALHVSGWYDIVQVGTTENFINLSEQASDPQIRRQQHLLIGPWAHMINAGRQLGAIDFGPDAVIDFRNVQLRWFDHWLKGIDNGVDREPRVRLYIMGANHWVDENEWPIARTTYVKYYLHGKGRANSRWGDGQLSRIAPVAESADHFRYDPTDPAPFLGHLTDFTDRNQWPLPDDYRDVEARPDVLVYTSAPMTEPTLVCGPLRVKLFAASSAVDTDWTARVLDVWRDGFAERLNDGIVRGRFRLGNDKEVLLKPGETYAYDIDVWSTCVELQKSHRVRLEISSSAFPMFDRNLNTGATLGMETGGVVAEQTVLHDRKYASYLLLPIVPPHL